MGSQGRSRAYTHCVRVLALSDLHYRLPVWDWLLDAARDADLVTISGDLLDIVAPVPHEAQATVVGAYLRRLSDTTRVAVCSGNHDLDGPGPSGEQEAAWLSELSTPTLTTDGHSIDVGDTRVTVVGWWDGPRTRERVAEQLREAAQDRPERWVWVYHAPPAGTRLCFDGRRSFCDEYLQQWIEELSPDLVLCGHIHQAPWVDGGGWYDRLGSTVIINPGKQIGRVPPHVWLDLDLGTAAWSGLGESSVAALS
jgi:Icc-related predicted phosphoesterase